MLTGLRLGNFKAFAETHGFPSVPSPLSSALIVQENPV